MLGLSMAQVYGQHAPIRAKMVWFRKARAAFGCRSENCCRSSNGFPVCPPLWCASFLPLAAVFSQVGLETVLDMDDHIEFEDTMNLEAKHIYASAASMSCQANSAASRFTGPNRPYEHSNL